MNILLVEDEPELSKIAAEAMEGMGHSVRSVSGVEQALAAFEEDAENIHLLIADHRLPDGWGIALCLQCRVKYPAIRVAVVSGCLTKENIDTLEDYEIPYFRKPILYSSVLKQLFPAVPPPTEQKDQASEEA